MDVNAHLHLYTRMWICFATDDRSANKQIFFKKKQDSDECVGVCTEHVYAHVTFGKYFHQNSSSISTVNAHVVE